jgi:hypothetical protein
VERGTHEVLLAQRGEYAALWRRQTRMTIPADEVLEGVGG